jgi:hypothetical protein
MNPTDHLVAAVTASLLLASPHARQPADSAFKTDPKVKAAAERIVVWLDSVSTDPKSRAEIVAHLPTLAPLVDNALKRASEYEGRLRRSGDGTAERPYRWYSCASGCG